MFECETIKIPFKETEISVGVYRDHKHNKKDVLFLHGMGSNTKDSYEKILDKFPKDRVCAIDWLGHGATTKLFRKKDTYGAQYMTDYLETVIDALIKENILDEKFFVIANSMSAIPIAYLYPRYEKHIKKIVFINPAGMDKKMGYIFAFFSGFITKNIVLSWMSSFLVSNKKARKILQKNLRVKDWGIIVSKYANMGYDYLGHMKRTHYIPELFEKIKKPVLLICGEKDSIFTKREYLNFALEHGWSVCVLKKEEHTLGKGDPVEMDKKVEEFLF
ncbi:MAG: alpha/beta hydrolase [Patescibacteria group bacterium]|nr:alpha/beta hydrolase [Patescibacteria group bacterium]